MNFFLPVGSLIQHISGPGSSYERGVDLICKLVLTVMVRRISEENRVLTLKIGIHMVTLNDIRVHAV